MKTKLLVVDDEKNMIWALNNALSSKKYCVVNAMNGVEAIKSFKNENPSLVLLDIKLPDIDGIEVLKELKKIDSNIPIIMMTAHGTIQTAITAMKIGATDYLSKPFDLEELKIIIEKALDIGEMKKQIYFLKNELKKTSNIAIIGKEKKFIEVIDMAKNVASSDATVLISGESGTGKEVVADYIHNLSERNERPLIKVNCASLSDSLLESELFGHEKGAFTGAFEKKLGRFERADGGSIFLDEIGEISQNVQVKLLRIIQQKEFERVGGIESLKLDVRIIAATNRDLKKLVEEGKFREDLFYRLNVIPIHMPPLRERKNDIPLLIEYFLKKYSVKMHKENIKFSKESIELMKNYRWRGNIRELENIIERMVILSKENIIKSESLPIEIFAKESIKSNYKLPEKGIKLDELEKEFILQALKKVNNNQTNAAKLLGITRHTLLYRMGKYKLKK
ncbi:sigma-54-dependent transcriptional regulator [Helicovermis profundi]|uniref:Stage 0 sporulation protein A homolog n=1 Tax=Helicovermis profundi TaxID=3065157 RepID=A0AAU9E2C1_9FIRM|nr:sigma-54 dependent transcriptional regulator [Clostridia bacterium S502]